MCSIGIPAGTWPATRVPELLVSSSTGLDDPRMARYCRTEHPFRVECFEPRP